MTQKRHRWTAIQNAFINKSMHSVHIAIIT